MSKQSLEPSQKRQLETWIDEVREYEDTALKWAKTLYCIKESGYWTSRADTWPAFCEQEFGYKKAMSYRYVACGEVLEKHKEQISKESNPPTSLRQIERLEKVYRGGQKKIEGVGTEIVSKDTMSAKADPEWPMHYSVPVPAPVCALQPATVPISVANKLDLIIREAKRLTESGPAEFKGQAFQHLVRELQILRNGMQMEFPTIMAQVPVAKPRSRCTIEEAKAFCKTIGLPEDDGEWFFWKMDGAGWKNSGVAVASWQGTIQAWKRAGYMCSQTAAARAQRNGGPEKPEQRASKELDREIAKLRRMQ